MGKQPQEVTIDDNIYIIAMLKPKVASPLLVRLLRLLAPSMGKAFSGPIKLKEIFDAPIDIGAAVTELAARVNEAEVTQIIDILFTQVVHKGQGTLTNEAVVDELFSGRIKHMFNVVRACLEVQYADFLEGRDAIEAIQQTAKSILPIGDQ